ncbi:MAG: short-chain dehydrogenase/reductase [Ilumatobacteraceae bacterium]|nr:short-chain dehydrogenase/reductase [Ilumatobacteraceae bacterium]
MVVTGASRGLGRAFAIALGAEGARVVVNGTNDVLVAATVDAITSAGGAAVPCVGSVADDAVAEGLIATCVTAFGGIDAVVNNAGVVRDRTLMNMTPDEFDEVIAVNLRGTWSVSRHAARAMKEQGGGLLLQIISGSAFTGSVGQTNYAASKAGVMGMLYAWDTELKRHGIRTNAVWPVAETDMTQVVLNGVRQRAHDAGKPEPSAEQIGFGQPADVAALIVYMCSERADHLRSQLVTFNGSKLALWTHPCEAEVHRQPSWTIDQIADVLHDAASPVHVPEF